MTYIPSPFYIKNRYKQLTSSVAHQIKGPLVNINLAADLLKNAIIDDTLLAYLNVIVRNAASINTSVNSSLAISPLTNGAPQRYSLHGLLDEVLEGLSDKIASKNITVNKFYNPDDCILVLNKAKLKISLTNIIKNAVEAMDPQNGQLTITTKFVNGKYLLHIQDNGCGISKVNHSFLFKNCFTSKTGSLGLGLPTIYHFLRLNDINTNIESEEGEGTLFSLAFNK